MSIVTDVDAINWPHESVREAWDAGIYTSGVTEPWCQQAVAALLVATGQRTVLELGSYLGYTTAWLACTLERMGGGSIVGVEHEPERANHAYDVLLDLDLLDDVQWTIARRDALDFLRADHATYGFAWVDDDHTAAHVNEELSLLKPRMAPGGLICMHDVSGPLGLDEVCRAHGGYVLHFPRLGPAGGLGLIQV